MTLHMLTDTNGDVYGFNFDPDTSVAKRIGCVEITWISPSGGVKGFIVRPVKNIKVIWESNDIHCVSKEAMIYCERLARLTAFH